MKREQAYQVLGVSPGTGEEEVKKKYRELSRKYHPDVSTEPDASEKIKQINEAYTRIKNQDFEQESPQGFGGFGFGGFEDIIFNMGGFGSPFKTKLRNVDNIQVNISLTFKESIFGCKKSISFDRDIKCNDCEGAGSKQINNGCTHCGGKGKTVISRGNVFSTSICGHCRGKVMREPCKTCNSSGAIKSSTNISVNIPGGVIDKNILRLSGIGNFSGINSFGEISSDVYVHLNVEKNDKFTIDSENIIYNLNISLLESLEGCSKSVETLEGDTEITIPKLSKHKDSINLPRLGVNKRGDQVVTLNVIYPEDIDKLIKSLKEN